VAFPDGWGRKHSIIIDNTKVSGSGSHSGFIVFFDKSNVDSEVLEAGSNSALNGGGDIRLSSDEAGTTQLPLDVIQCVTNASEANRKLFFATRIPSLSTSADTTIWLWYKKAGENQPAVGAAYGRNAVYVDEELAMVFVNITAASNVDRSGNHTVTANGVFDASTDDGQDFNGTTNYFSTPYAASLDFSSGMALRCFAPVTTAGGDQYIVSRPWDTTWGFPYSAYGIYVRSNNTFSPIIAESDDFWTYNSGTIAPSTNKYFAATYNQSTLRCIVDGSLANSGSPTFALGNRSSGRAIGCRSGHDDGEYFDGVLKIVLVRDVAVSDDWAFTEDANQRNPDTFASSGTPQDAGGDTGLVITECVQSQTADNMVLTQDHSTQITSGAHSHGIDNITLLQAHFPIIEYCNHLQSCDALSLDLSINLAITESSHGHQIGTFPITQLHTLDVASDSLAHNVENVMLISASITLETGVSNHATFSEVLNLIQNSQITIQNTSNGLASDQLDLISSLLISKNIHDLFCNDMDLDQQRILRHLSAFHSLNSDETMLKRTTNQWTFSPESPSNWTEQPPSSDTWTEHSHGPDDWIKQ
jgi:hypothetical protein